MRVWLALVGALWSVIAAAADDISLGKEVFKSTNWSVRQTPDTLTGAMSCTGLYQRKYIVTLTEDALFVSLAPSGGFRSYTARFDNEPATAERTASPHEGAIQSIALTGGDFAQVLAAKRLQVQVTTSGPRPEALEIDLSDVKAAHAAIAAKACKGGVTSAPTMASQTKAFDLPEGTKPNSVSPAPDGKVWFTATRPGVFGILDPATGAVRIIPLGKDSVPHDVIPGKDGNAWITDSGQDAILRVDAKTDEVKLWPLPKGLGRSSLNGAVFDNDGNLWFTGAGANGEYAKLDVNTGEVKAWKPPASRYTFGITVTPTGEIWYASVVPAYIARVDRDTGASTVIDTPYAGSEPHRLRSDSKGNIWIDEWTRGYLTRYVPKTGAWKSWNLPGAKPSHASGIFVDDKDIVWVIQRGANTTYAFDPAREKFVDGIPGTKPAAGAKILGQAGVLWVAETNTGRIVMAKTGSTKAAVH